MGVGLKSIADLRLHEQQSATYYEMNYNNI